MTTLIINIKELLQVRETAKAKVSGAEMAILPTIKNAFLVIEDNLIADFGKNPGPSAISQRNSKLQIPNYKQIQNSKFK